MCAHSCPTLCDPKDRRPPGSSVQGISQEKVLEWVAISYSRRSSHLYLLLQEIISPVSLASPELAGRYFTNTACGKPPMEIKIIIYDKHRVHVYSC